MTETMEISREEMLEFAKLATFHLDDRLVPYDRETLRAEAWLMGYQFARRNGRRQTVEPEQDEPIAASDTGEGDTDCAYFQPEEWETIPNAELVGKLILWGLPPDTTNAETPVPPELADMLSDVILGFIVPTAFPERGPTMRAWNARGLFALIPPYIHWDSRMLMHKEGYRSGDIYTVRYKSDFQEKAFHSASLADALAEALLWIFETPYLRKQYDAYSESVDGNRTREETQT